MDKIAAAIVFYTMVTHLRTREMPQTCAQYFTGGVLLGILVLALLKALW